MVIVVVRGVTLENAKEGLSFFLEPKFERLIDAIVII